MKLLRGASRQPLPRMHHDDGCDDALPLASRHRKKSRIKITGDTAVSLSITLVGAIRAIKPGRCLLALGTM